MSVLQQEVCQASGSRETTLFQLRFVVERPKRFVFFSIKVYFMRSLLYTQRESLRDSQHNHVYLKVSLSLRTSENATTGGSGKSSFDVSGLGIYFIRNGRFHLIVRYCPLFCQKVAGPARTSQSTVGGGKNQLKVL
jgi:hypothetical protein